MAHKRQLALSEATEWLGDWHPLAEQLGSANGLVTLGSVSSLLQLPPIQNRSALRQLLQNYQQQVLLPLELPAIRAAHGHTQRHELAEMIEFDQKLAAEPLLQPYLRPSRRLGQYHLQRLRPLRDERVVQRYLHAVETGTAHGWHTVVTGITLAVYSLPLRQGLLGYAHQTTRGFIYAGARLLALSEHECRSLFDGLCAGLPQAVEDLICEPRAA
jgi:urease accessory protein UreF